VCRIAVEYGQFVTAFVGIPDFHNGVLKPIAWQGRRAENLENWHISMGTDGGMGGGPASVAVRDGIHFVCNDIAGDGRLAAVGEKARQCGYHSAAAFPIHLQNRIVGVLSLYADQPDFFDEETVRLLDEVVVDLSFALQTFEEAERRIAAERILRRQAEILDQVHDSIVSTDLDGRITTWNKGAERLFGYTVEDAIGRQFSFLYETEESFPRDEILRVLEATGTYEDRVRMRKKSGEIIYVHLSLSGSEDDHGAQAGVIAYSIDVTDAWLAEEALRESEERFRQMAETINEVFWMQNEDLSRLIYISPAYERVWGRSSEGLYRDTRSYTQAVHPEDQEYVMAAVLALTREGKYDVEYRIVRPDGVTRWIWDRAFPIHDGSGRVYRYAGIAQDITERKQAEQILRKQASLLDLTHDTIFVRNIDNVITYWNSGAGERYGWTEREAVGQVSHELMQTVFPAPLEEIDAELLRTGRWEGELLHTRRDGTRLVVASRWALECDQSGKPVAVLETNNDITVRKRAEEDLRRNEAYLREAQRLSHTGSFGWNVASGELFWSAETFRIFQYDLSVKPSLELVLQRTHPDDAALVQQVMGDAEKFGRSFNFAHRLLLPDGSVRDLQVVSYAVGDVQSRKFEFIGAVMDVTERRRADAALRRSEAYLRDAQRLTRTGSFGFNAKTKEMTHSSDENTRLFGYDPEMGVPAFEQFFARIDAGDHARLREALESAIRGRTEIDWQFRVVTPDTSVKHIHGTAHPVFDAAGEVVEFVGNNVDVTERKRAEEERERLRQRERTALAEAIAAQRRFQDLVDSVEGIVWEAEGPQFEFSFVSKQAERVLGYPVERWLGEAMFRREHLHTDDRDRVVEFYEGVIAGKRSHDVEYRMIAADGTAVWMRDLVSVSGEGTTTLLRGVMFDITARKRAEEEIRELNEELERRIAVRTSQLGQANRELAQRNEQLALASRMKSEFLTRVSHEFRTPLNSVLGFSDLLAEESDGKLGEIYFDYVRHVQDGANHLLALVNDILDLSKIEAGRIELRYEEFAAVDAIVEVLSVTGPLADLKKVVLRSEVPETVLVYADRTRFKQIFYNLLSNAVKFTPAEGMTTVSARLDGEEVLFTVKDTGIGIAEEEQEAIFHEFHQAGPSTSGLKEGTGLGLAITRRLVEFHGGRIWVESSEGKGSSFFLTIPAARAGEEGTTKPGYWSTEGERNHEQGPDRR
jgi:PAS domain S-box-containing protein